MEDIDSSTAVTKSVQRARSSFKVRTIPTATGIPIDNLNLDVEHSHQLDACSVAA